MLIINSPPAPPHLWGNPLALHLCLFDKDHFRCSAARLLSPLSSSSLILLFFPPVPYCGLSRFQKWGLSPLRYDCVFACPQPPGPLMDSNPIRIFVKINKRKLDLIEPQGAQRNQSQTQSGFVWSSTKLRSKIWSRNIYIRKWKYSI